MKEKRLNGSWRVLLRVILFVCLTAALVYAAGSVLNNNGDQKSANNIGRFYGLEENSLDAVYIGSSRVYAFWTPLFAFEQRGICVWNYASPASPLEAVPIFIDEILKTPRRMF